MADASDTAFAIASEIKPSVLIFVDDGSEPILPESLLFEAGYSVHVEYGIGHLPDSNEHPLPDLIIWQLTQLSPDKLRELSRFKRERPLSEIGLLVLLKRGDTGAAMRAIAAGADDCFIRPLNQRVLLMRLAFLAGSPQESANEAGHLADAGYFFYDIERGRQRFNRRISDMFGVADEAVIADPRCLWDAVHADDFERVSSALQAAPQQACEQTVKFRLSKTNDHGRMSILKPISSIYRMMDLSSALSAISVKPGGRTINCCNRFILIP